MASHFAKFSIMEKIIDMHVHLWGHSLEADQNSLRGMLDRYPIAWLGVIPLWGGHYPSAEEIRVGNDATFAFCKTDPQRLKAYVTVNPCHTNAPDELQRGYDAGVTAAKVWVAARADDPVIFSVAEKCIALNLPLLLHSFHKTVGQLPHETDAQHVAGLAKRYPELKIVMAHLAGNPLWGCAHIADCPNVWSDFSGSYCESDTIETAIYYLGEDRVLFGSDAPGADYLNNWGKMVDANISPEQRHKIAYLNAHRLYGC
jgi:predicted TIM-barrel fold metal-dependent hydrolase